MFQLEFIALIKTEKLQSKHTICLVSQTPINTYIRFDCVNHFILQAGKQSTAKFAKQTHCEKCTAMQHANCFYIFHK